jgi:hypothetical protein
MDAEPNETDERNTTMALFFNDLYVDTLSKGLLQPGEQLMHRMSGHHAPWWAMGLAPLSSQYLVLATNQRLVLVRHRKGWLTGHRMESVQSVGWNEVSKLKMSGLFAKKTVTVQAGALKLDLKVGGGMFEIPKNVEDGKAIATRFAQMRALPS